MSDHNDAGETIYQAARHEGQAVLRRAILETASRLLVEKGHQALTMRRIAKEVGCSTMVLYNLFGGKDGVAEGLYLEGFEYLVSQIAQTPAADCPFDFVGALCHTYREVALDKSTHYAIMFQQAIPEYTPSEETKLQARQSLDPLVTALQQCIEANILKPQTAEPLSMMLWTAAHGFVSLELAGYLPTAEAGKPMYQQLIVGLLDAHRVEVTQ